MKTKLIPIGNSRGLRLPKKLIDMYHFENELVLEAREEGIIIKAPQREGHCTWEETWAEMAAEAEDWDDFDVLADEGLDK
jgi:antitoxin MazE